MSRIEITDASKFKEIVTEGNDNSVIMEDGEEEGLFKTRVDSDENSDSDNDNPKDEEKKGWIRGKFSRNENDKIHIGKYLTFLPNKKGIPRVFIGPDCNEEKN